MIYYLINDFSFVRISPTLVILIHIINFCFDIICSYGIILCCYIQRFSFSFEVSSAQPCSSHLMCNFLSLLLEVSKQLFFFPFCFLDFVILQFVLILILLLLAAVISLSLLFLYIPQGPELLYLFNSQFPFSFLFLRHNICLCHLLGVLSLSFGSFIWVPLLSIIRMVQSIILGDLARFLFL